MRQGFVVLLWKAALNCCSVGEAGSFESRKKEAERPEFHSKYKY